MKLKKASLIDIDELQKICKETYPIYFGNYWEGNGLEMYLEDQFGTDCLKADLNSDLIKYYLIYFEETPIGFLKINLASPLDGFEKEKTCELEKMYILPNWKGKGIGKAALQEAINRIGKFKKAMMFVGVVDSNIGAISFYEKFGFKYHDKIRVDIPFFKEELRGLNRMVLELK